MMVIGNTPTDRPGPAAHVIYDQPYLLGQGAAEDSGEVLGVAGETSVAPREGDQRGPEAFGEGGTGALGELALGRGASSGYNAGGRGLEGSDVGLVEGDGQQPVTEEPLACRRHLGRRRLLRGVLAPSRHLEAGDIEKLLPTCANPLIPE